MQMYHLWIHPIYYYSRYSAILNHSYNSQQDACKLSIKQWELIFAWIWSHPHVFFSPIARDTVLVNDPDNPGSFILKSKIILQCSIAKLHGDIYSPTTGLCNDVIDNDGKHLVSDTMFRGLLPPELRVMSNHYKTVCCCEICQGFNYLQSALESFCVQLLLWWWRSSRGFQTRRISNVILSRLPLRRRQCTNSRHSMVKKPFIQEEDMPVLQCNACLLVNFLTQE